MRNQSGREPPETERKGVSIVPEEFLTVKEVAERLRVTERSVQRYIAAGKLKAYGQGRGVKRLIPVESLEEYLVSIYAPVEEKGKETE